jgi:UDP-glucose 4-epimerase
MRVALTGASGNFGRVFRAKVDGDVIAINRGDWDDIATILSRGVEVVIHAASDLQSSVACSPFKMLDSNLVSTARLLEAMKIHKIPRLIFLSSCAVYGDSIFSSESDFCNPVSINGVCKLLNEKIISDFCQSNGIKYEILRVFNMYGGQDNFSILSHIGKSLKNQTPFVLNNSGVAQRDFIHVNDVASIVFKLLTIDHSYTTLNIGTGIATKISTMINLIREKYPELVIVNKETRESEYSRADISLLNFIIDHKFIKIEDYLTDSFGRDLAL